MLKVIAIAIAILAAAGSRVQAQTDLTAYADANGYINVQALTCAALAGPGRKMLIGSRRGTAVGTMALARSTTSTLPGPKSWSMKSLFIAKRIRKFES